MVGTSTHFIVETFNAGRGDVEVRIINPLGTPEQVMHLLDLTTLLLQNIIELKSTDFLYLICHLMLLCES